MTHQQIVEQAWAWYLDGRGSFVGAFGRLWALHKMAERNAGGR